MPEIAAALAAVWFLTAFALRIGLQVVRHHDTGVRLHGEAPLSWAWWARVGFVVATLAVAVAPVALFAGGLDPIAALDRTGLAAAGLVVAVAGIVLTFGAQLAMGASWRIGVRNPIFSTMALTAVGLTLMAPTGPGIAGLVALLAALEVQVRLVEEPHLHRHHGATYDAYTTQVGRFVPRPRPRARLRLRPTGVSRGGGRRRGPGAGR
jgi:protein-S-isoprenylcysteine O-methyltransferase Ste14